MKRFFLILTFGLFVLTGCDSNMDNTPTKRVEAFFNNYQTLDSSVLEDLDSVLMADTSLSDDDRDGYREFMKKHYKDLKYEIKDEKIDGDTASVETLVTVRSYANSISSAENYKEENADDFNDESGNYDATLFSSYRLDEMEKVTETSTYTIIFSLTKENDVWKINDLSDEDLNKINGLYAG